MHCSNCKIISIRIPNCATENIRCENCAKNYTATSKASDNNKERFQCPMCERLIRQTEFRLEGIIKAFFKGPPMTDINPDFPEASPSEIMMQEDVDSNCGDFMSRPSFDDLDFSNCETYYGTADVHEDVPLQEFCVMNVWNENTVINRRLHIVGDSNKFPCRKRDNEVPQTNWNRNQNNLKASNSISEFSMDKLDENDQSDTSEHNQEETHINSNLDRFHRNSQSNNVYEYFRRSNLDTARKSSSEMEFSGKSVEVNNSSNFNMLRESQNMNQFIASQDFVTYENQQNISRATNRHGNNIPSNNKVNNSYHSNNNYNNNNNNNNNNNTQKKVSTNECGSFKNNSTENKSKTAARNLTDSLLIEPCLDLIDYSSLNPLHTQSIQRASANNQSLDTNINNRNPTISEPQSNWMTQNSSECKNINPSRIENMNTNIETNHSGNKVPDNMAHLKHYLREKFRCEVYGNFQKNPSEQKKTSDPLDLHIESKKVSPSNVEKTPSLQPPISPRQKRDEMIQKAKNELREKFYQEVYANFNKKSNDSNILNFAEPNVIINLADSGKNPLREKYDNQMQFIRSNEEYFPPYLYQSPRKDVRDAGNSTESYPKLNPELLVINASEPKTKLQMAKNSVSGNGKFLPFSTNELTPQEQHVNDLTNQIYKYIVNQALGVLPQQTENSNLSKPGSKNSAFVEKCSKSSNTSSSYINKVDSSVQTNPVNGRYSNQIVSQKMEEQISKFSEGPFIQSTTENIFINPEASAARISSNKLETVDEESGIEEEEKSYHTKDLLQAFSEEFVSNKKSFNISDFAHFIEKFPGTTFKQLQELLMKIPDDGKASNENEMKKQTESARGHVTSSHKTECPRSKTEVNNPTKTEVDIPTKTEVNIPTKTEVNIPTKTEVNIPTKTEANISRKLRKKCLGQTDINMLTKDEFESLKKYKNLQETSTANLNARRAIYSPPPATKQGLAPTEPQPQFQNVNPIDPKMSAMIDKAPQSEARPAAELKIPRSPLNCPISTCQKLLFISEFTRHMKIDHAKIPVESILPGKCKNFFLDPKVDLHGKNKCHMVFLLTNKIRDLGSKDFKDYVPILVMSTKVHLAELLTKKPRKEHLDYDENFLMIWLTGLTTPELPIDVSLTAWARNGPKSKYRITDSGKLYSFRDDQDSRSVYKSSGKLLLSDVQCAKLTDDGKNMIELQVVFQ